MGLLDILNGMQNGPRGQRDPNAKGGMSPVTMALLALLAYKAYQKMSGGTATASPAGDPQPPIPDGTANAGLPGGLGDLLGGMLGGGSQAGASPGGLGDLLKGGLGGLLAGGAAGSILSGGLGDLLKQFEQNGQGDVARSWVGDGPNREIAPNDLARSIGADDIQALVQQTGYSQDEVLSALSRDLPGLVDQLTPDGRLPTEDEAARWV